MSKKKTLLVRWRQLNKDIDYAVNILYPVFVLMIFLGVLGWFARNPR